VITGKIEVSLFERVQHRQYHTLITTLIALTNIFHLSSLIKLFYVLYLMQSIGKKSTDRLSFFVVKLNKDVKNEEI